MWLSGGSSSTTSSSSSESTGITAVPDTFTSASHYIDVWFPLLLKEMQAQTISEVTQEGVGPCCQVMVANLGIQNQMTVVNVTKFMEHDGQAQFEQQPRGAGGKRIVKDSIQNDLIIFVLDPQVVLGLARKSRGSKAGPPAGPSSGGLKGFLAICHQPARAQGGLSFRVSTRRYEALGSPTVLYGFVVRSLFSSVRELSAIQAIDKVSHEPCIH